MNSISSGLAQKDWVDWCLSGSIQYGPCGIIINRSKDLGDEGGGDRSHSSSPQSLGAVPPAAIHATYLGDVPHRFGELGQDAGIRKHR